MKVRKQGKIRTAHLVINAKWSLRIAALLALTPEEEAESQRRIRVQWDEVLDKMKLGALVEEPTPVQTFTVAKKSTGEVIGTYTDLGEAEEVVLKAKRQKKAALEIVGL